MFDQKRKEIFLSKERARGVAATYGIGNSGARYKNVHKFKNSVVQKNGDKRKSFNIYTETFVCMNSKRPGRKSDFPGKKIRRIAFILPEDMAIKLDVHAAKSIMSRNQIIHEALKAYLGEGEE